MHFQMKIQPVDHHSELRSVNFDNIPVVKPVLKSRLKRLFEFQFPSVLKNSSETVTGAETRDGEFEPSSVCLAKMVQNFIEDSVPEKPKCGRNRCNCFNGNINDVSDDESDFSGCGIFSDSPSESLKSLSACVNIHQRNLLADTSKIVEKNRNHKPKSELRKLVAEELTLIGYDASICKSRWEKSSSYPAGEYEYLDSITKSGDRIIIDIDFRSEFEIARPTGAYKAILQSLPFIFVGDANRLQQILSIVSEAAKQSMRKKGMHIPPWRTFEYMKSKWLSSHIRTPLPLPSPLPLTTPPTPPPTPDAGERNEPASVFSPELETECGVFELILGEETTSLKLTEKKSGEEDESSPVVTWQLPELKPRSKLVVTGLASLFREKA